MNTNQNTITFFNQCGDVTIAWDNDANEEMLNVIQNQMDKGVTFWQVESRFGGFLPPKKTKLNSISDIENDKVLSIRDDDFIRMVSEGMAAVIETSRPNRINTTGLLKTPKDVISNKSKSSIAINSISGG